MNASALKSYLFVSDFDQTLTFNDSGYVLSEIVGIPTEEFERKAKGMTKLNLVQQGAQLAYLLLHDPDLRSRVRKEHLIQVGKQISLKSNIGLLNEILDHGIEGYHFDFFVLSSPPVRWTPSSPPPPVTVKFRSSANSRPTKKSAPTTWSMPVTAAPTYTSCSTSTPATVSPSPSPKLNTSPTPPSAPCSAPTPSASSSPSLKKSSACIAPKFANSSSPTGS